MGRWISALCLWKTSEWRKVVLKRKLFLAHTCSEMGSKGRNEDDNRTLITQFDKLHFRLKYILKKLNINITADEHAWFCSHVKL